MKKTKGKFCPLLGGRDQCGEENCAWFDEEEKTRTCVLNLIAARLIPIRHAGMVRATRRS